MTEHRTPDEKLIVAYINAAITSPVEELVESGEVDDTLQSFQLETQQLKGVLDVLERLGLDVATLAALNQQTAMVFRIEHLEHYKGGHYIKVGDGIHTETNEDEVIYYRPEDTRWFVRPAAMFKEAVNVAGELRARFTPKPMKRFLEDLF